jgi:hypothetical protein
MIDDFDEYDENPLKTKTFDELKKMGADRLSECDISEVFMYLRDTMRVTAEDLQHRDDPEDVSMGGNCARSAMYLNLALKAFMGL